MQKALNCPQLYVGECFFAVHGSWAGVCSCLAFFYLQCILVWRRGTAELWSYYVDFNDLFISLLIPLPMSMHWKETWMDRKILPYIALYNRVFQLHIWVNLTWRHIRMTCQSWDLNRHKLFSAAICCCSLGCIGWICNGAEEEAAQDIQWANYSHKSPSGWWVAN